jgi:hypothetical protein
VAERPLRSRLQEGERLMSQSTANAPFDTTPTGGPEPERSAVIGEYAKDLRAIVKWDRGLN